VGEIRTDSTNYNAAHWDGEGWELSLISPRGNVGPIKAIHIINANDIWFEKWGLPIHWDGENYRKFTPADDGYPSGCTINSIWGTSSSNMYFVGNNGSIVHYDGSSFTKLEIGMEIDGDFVDIDGTANGEKVFVVIFQYWHAPHKMVVFQIENETVITLFYSDDNTTDYGGYKGPIAVKVIDDYAYIKVYENLWRHNWKYNRNEFISLVEDCSPAHRGITKLAANDHNDLFGMSFKGWFMHYNGSSWSCDYSLESPNIDYKDFSVNNNIVIMVGETADWRGLIARGVRN
jgi:hypothetical protein